jgi:hypothetical protein
MDWLTDRRYAKPEGNYMKCCSSANKTRHVVRCAELVAEGQRNVSQKGTEYLIKHIS